jgi:hypothetical protein
MPKNVLRPEDFKDCKEDYQEGLGMRDSTKIILIGNQGETEAKRTKKRKPPTIGREFRDHETLSLCYAKLKNLQQEGQYNYLIGRVLYPNRRGEGWSQSRNQAFIAGVIAAKRPVLLVTPIENYTGFPTGTVNELMWLDKAGYKFKRDKTYPTKIWAYPPQELKCTEIADYTNDTEYSNRTFRRVFRKNEIRSLEIPVPDETAELNFVIQSDDFFDGLFQKTFGFSLLQRSTEEYKADSSTPPSSSSSSSSLPQSSSSSTSSRESLADRKVLSSMPMRSRKKLSVDQFIGSVIGTLCKESKLEIGAAFSEGDCFFDSIAQGLERNGITIPGDPTHSGCKKLRMLCDHYIRHNDTTGWIKRAIENDVQTGGQSYQDTLVQMQYTQDEIEKMKQGADGSIYKRWFAIWGRPYIEGRIICAALNVKLDVIDIMQMREGGAEKGRIEKLQCAHRLVDFQQSVEVDIDKIDYADTRIVHIVNYRSHYVPLLPYASLRSSESVSQSSSSSVKSSISSSSLSSSASSSIQSLSISKSGLFSGVIVPSSSSRPSSSKSDAAKQVQSKSSSSVASTSSSSASKSTSSKIVNLPLSVTSASSSPSISFQSSSSSSSSR